MILWKRGVTTRGDFACKVLERENQHRGWWPFSYRILKELEQHYTPTDEPLLERLYRSLAAGEGVFKITRRGRFDAFDRELVSRSQTAFPPDRELVIHDMGVSSGITSLDLYHQFRTHRPVRLIASDYYDELKLVHLPQRFWSSDHWTVAFDSQHRAIQTTGLGTVFGTQPYPWRYALVRFAQWWVNFAVIPAARKALEQGPSNAVETVQLFHPDALHLANDDSSFQLIQHDIFQRNPIPCQIVRAMNVVTPRHFTPTQTQAAIRASVHQLVEGGWLILGRSIDEEDGRLRATVYERRDGRLLPLWDYHGGYEWPDLVRPLQLDQPSTTGVAP